MCILRLSYSKHCDTMPSSHLLSQVLKIASDLKKNKCLTGHFISFQIQLNSRNFHSSSLSMNIWVGGRTNSENGGARHDLLVRVCREEECICKHFESLSNTKRILYQHTKSSKSVTGATIWFITRWTSCQNSTSFQGCHHITLHQMKMQQTLSATGQLSQIC